MVEGGDARERRPDRDRLDDRRLQLSLSFVSKDPSVETFRPVEFRISRARKIR